MYKNYIARSRSKKRNGFLNWTFLSYTYKSYRSADGYRINEFNLALVFYVGLYVKLQSHLQLISRNGARQNFAAWACTSMDIHKKELNVTLDQLKSHFAHVCFDSQVESLASRIDHSILKLRFDHSTIHLIL